MSSIYSQLCLWNLWEALLEDSLLFLVPITEYNGWLQQPPWTMRWAWQRKLHEAELKSRVTAILDLLCPPVDFLYLRKTCPFHLSYCYLGLFKIMWPNLILTNKIFHIFLFQWHPFLSPYKSMSALNLKQQVVTYH